MILHMNMGSKGHIAQFQITDDKGVVMPFVRAYNTSKKDGYNGFFFVAATSV
jgi:hypothetical protein